jgi:hypothetical protein
MGLVEGDNSKIKTCGICFSWVHDGNVWGHCAKITENSDMQGAMLESICGEPMYAQLSVRKDFGCKLFKELDIWQN